MAAIFDSTFAPNYEIGDIEGIFKKELFDSTLSQSDLEVMKNVFTKSHSHNIDSRVAYDTFVRQNHIGNKYNKIKLFKGYRMLLHDGQIQRNPQLEKFMKFKATRGNSGVVVITTFMSGNLMNGSIRNGGCPENCAYCPFEKDADGIPTQPRSYLSTEPGNMRATQNKHHPVGQVFDRADTLEKMGHISCVPDVSSKIEMIISGGTFNFFPENYIVWYVTSTYYALNVYYDYKLTGKLRDMLTLEEEQQINETAALRMIGLTIETRPDRLIDQSDPLRIVRFFRRLGVTRVQIGVQHTDDKILKYVRRNCTNEQNKNGIRILKQNGFKTDIHLMLDLPSSTPEADKLMIDTVINDPDLQADQWKVYPTEVTPYTDILKWYEDGTYQPYAEIDNGELLEDVIVHLKKQIHPYIRINRVIRDIPVESIEGGIKCPDMRNNIMMKMKDMGMTCKCIRCREVKGQTYEEPYLFVNKYKSSGGIEYFISYENKTQTVLYGMLRLRINIDQDMTMGELYDCALIRELHVYGSHSEIGDSVKSEQTQHRGLGKKLLKIANDIAYQNGLDKIVVISGIGVREYYRKNGFEDYYTYMIKNIETPNMYLIINIVIVLLAYFMFVVFLFF